MDANVLKDLVDQKLSITEISAKTNKSKTTVSYWIKKYNLKIFRGPHGKLPRDKSLLTFKCKCGETDPDKFYGHKKSICGKCQNKYNLEFGRLQRDKALVLLGEKCKLCQFDKYKCSLDIHHTDPSKKDPNFASMRYWSWSRIENELKTCVLLCRNCHAAVHNNLVEV